MNAIMRHVSLLISSLTIGFGAIAGCGLSEPAAKPTEHASTAEQLPNAKHAPTAEPASLPESESSDSIASAVAFANELEAAFHEDEKSVNSKIDWGAMLVTATHGIDAPEAFRRNYVQNLRQMIETGGFASQIISTIERGGHLEFVRIVNVDDEQRALFRLILPEGDVSYFGFVIEREEGELQVIDVWTFASAEKITETWHRLYLLGAAAADPTLRERLSGTQRDFVEHANEIAVMSNANRAGDYQRVIDTFGRLSRSLRQEKAILLIRMNAAVHLGENAYLHAIEDLREAHPDDPCVDFHSIGAYNLVGRHDQALESVNRLDEVVADPFLNTLRATTYLMKGDRTAARESAETALAKVPHLPDTYWSLIAIDLAEENFSNVAQWLTKLEDELAIELADLTTLPGYADFVKSPEYEAWSKSRAKN